MNKKAFDTLIQIQSWFQALPRRRLCSHTIFLAFSFAFVADPPSQHNRTYEHQQPTVPRNSTSAVFITLSPPRKFLGSLRDHLPSLPSIDR